MTILQVEQVSLAASVGSSYLLRDVYFEVIKGDRLAIIGPSGAGKTSLLRLLNRLITPSKGKIYLENQEYNHINVIKLRSQVVLVPQEPKLLGMKVEETLAYPLILQQLPKKEIKQRVQNWVERVGIPEEWLERNELQLSLGQRQLVAIVRGLIMEPKILLLDEPTSALDIGRGTNLLAILNELSLNHTTILMVNHQLELAQQFATRVLYFQEGMLIADTPATQVNWSELRENLIKQESKTRAEWTINNE